jgi:cytochrome c553
MGPVVAAVLAAAGAAPAVAPAAEAPPPPGAVACTGCHGRAFDAAGFPKLAGLEAPRIAEALASFRAGTREATVMGRIAKGFSDEESQAIAVWIAERPR